MSKTKLFMILNLAVALGASIALAEAGKDAGKDSGKEGKPGGGTQAAISWEEMKERCQHPRNFPAQVAPENIKVQCSDSVFEYVPSSSGEIPLAGSRTVLSAVLSDKYYVSAGAAAVAVNAKGGSCLRFKEVEKTVTIERPLSCDDVLNIKGDVAEYCVGTLDSVKGGNPKLLQVRDTGRLIDTCANVAQGGGTGK